MSDQSISNSDLGRLRNLIHAQAGIRLGPDKKTMLELRIRPRLRSLALNSYREYCDYVFSVQGQRDEMVHLLDAVSTNKTDFFREPAHFEYLIGKALPEILKDNRCGRPVSVWSAGCSSGEEPYTLSMVLSEYVREHSDFRFKVLATDLCTEVLAKARLAIYDNGAVQPVPIELRCRYFLRSREQGSNRWRIAPEIRNLVEFRHLNFMDPDFGAMETVEIIFCRNVIIYFDRSTQEQLLQKLAKQLVPGGYIFLGHSETLHGLDAPLAPMGPAVYRKIDAST